MGHRGRRPVTGRQGDGQRLSAQRHCLLVVAQRLGQGPCDGDRLHPCGAVITGIREREEDLQVRPPLAEVALLQPEWPQCARQPHRWPGFPILGQVPQCGSKVVSFATEGEQAGRRREHGPMGLGRLGERQEVVGVAPVGLLGRAARLQPLESVLSNRLQHPVAWRLFPQGRGTLDQTLVNQRGNQVEDAGRGRWPAAGRGRRLDQ